MSVNIGEIKTLTWETIDWVDNDNNDLPIHIEVSRDNGVTWETITSAAPNTGTYDWTITGPMAANAYIRLSDLTDPSVNWVSDMFYIRNGSSSSSGPSSNMVTNNVYFSSKWRLNFSNIPSVTKMSNLGLYEYFVKSFNIPDLSVDMMNINFHSSTIRAPMSKDNMDLSNLTIEFKCDENLDNYYNLYNWMQELKYGQNVPTKLIRENYIKKINLILLDNNRNKTKTYSFTNAFLINLSGLNLTMTSDNEVSFTTTFTYEEVKVKIT